MHLLSRLLALQTPYQKQLHLKPCAAKPQHPELRAH